MSSANAHRASGVFCAVAFGVLGALSAACGHDELPGPKAPAPAAAPAPKPEPALTSAAVPAKSGTRDIGLSDGILKACNIHISNVDQAPKFNFDEAELEPADRDVLNQVAQCVTTGPLKGRSLSLVGRADPRGEEEYNFTLGEKRANSVETYLKGLGVDSTKLRETSRGELDAKGTDEDGWAKDRRVDIDLAP